MKEMVLDMMIDWLIGIVTLLSIPFFLLIS